MSQQGVYFQICVPCGEDENDGIQQLIYEACNLCDGRNRLIAMGELLLAGARLKLEQAGDPKKVAEADREMREVYTRIKKRDSDHKVLCLIYEKEPISEFQRVCALKGIDPQWFLEEVYSPDLNAPKKDSWAKSTCVWLAKAVSDGKPHEPAEIRMRAEVEGVIMNEHQWAQMRVLASRLGISDRGHKGEWQTKT